MSLGSKFTKNAPPWFDGDSFCTGCLYIMVAGRSWKQGSAFGGFIGGCIQSRGPSLQDLPPCCISSPPASPVYSPLPESHAVFLHYSREAWGCIAVIWSHQPFSESRKSSSSNEAFCLPIWARSFTLPTSQETFSFFQKEIFKNPPNTSAFLLHFLSLEWELNQRGETAYKVNTCSL